MLCDEIIRDTNLPVLYPGYEHIQSLIRAAQKYSLAPDFAVAADGLINNTRELERIIPFCRLPSQYCWFELAQGDRPHFTAAPMHFSEHQTFVKRVGFLCVCPDPSELWKWVTVLVWSAIASTQKMKEFRSAGFTGNPNNTSIISIAFNTKDGFKPDPLDKLAGYVSVGMAPYAPKEMVEVVYESDKFAKLLQADWGGEIRYLIAVLGLFNARNVMEQASVDKTEHNRKRAKHGDLPLCSHTVLKIRAMHRRSLVGARGKGTAADIRKHFVSGHWKARRTGLFWWNPFWRGNAEHGEVTHDYVVET